MIEYEVKAADGSAGAAIRTRDDRTNHPKAAWTLGHDVKESTDLLRILPASELPLFERWLREVRGELVEELTMEATKAIISANTDLLLLSMRAASVLTHAYELLAVDETIRLIEALPQDGGT